MQMQKIIAVGAMATMLVGCEFLGMGSESAPSGDALTNINSAIDKTLEEYESASMTSEGEVVIKMAEPSGSVKVSFEAEGQGGKTEVEASYKLSFELDGDIKDELAAENGPESGSAAFSLKVIDETMYAKLDELKLEPAQVLAMLNMIVPISEVEGKWYSFDFEKFIEVANSGSSLKYEDFKDMNMKEIFVASIMQSMEEQGLNIEKKTVEEILDVVFDVSNYLKITGESSVSGGMKYSVEMDYKAMEGMADKLAKIAEKVIGTDRPEDFDEEVKEIIGKVKEVVSAKGTITVLDNGFIGGFSMDMKVTVPEGENDELESVSVKMSQEYTDINSDFEVTAPEDAEAVDLEELMGPMIMSTAMIDGGSVSSDTSDDFYPCDVYGPCSEETDTMVVDSAGDTWVYDTEFGMWVVETSTVEFYPCDDYGPCSEETDTKVVDADGDVWEYDSELEMWLPETE